LVILGSDGTKFESSLTDEALKRSFRAPVVELVSGSLKFWIGWDGIVWCTK
jgi:hypothetical protein